jgi:N-acetylglucosamine-6-sulfatase
MDPRPGWDRWVSFRGQGQYVYPDGQKSRPEDRGFNTDGTFAEVSGYVTDLLTDEALSWLGERPKDQPYLMVVSHKAVHAPLVGPPRHRGEFADVTAPAVMPDGDASYAGKPKWLRAMRTSELGVDGEYRGRDDPDEWYRNYFRCLLAVDDSIGRLLGALEARGEADSTAVVLVSDNGFMFGEKGVLDKRCFYEPSCRIPLIVRCPDRFPGGTKVEAHTLNIDFAPTILELCGLAPLDGVHGRSLVPCLSGKTPADWRTAWLYEYFYEKSYPQTPTVLGVRAGKYKYVTYHGVWEDDEVFDLEADPREEKNLALEQPDLRRELWLKLKEEADRVGCRLAPSWDKAEGDEEEG